MQIWRGASRVHRSRGNYNNNGSHNSVSPRARRPDDGGRVAARGRAARSLPHPSMCLSTHRETLQLDVHRWRKALFALRLHGIPETQSSLLWVRRDARRRRQRRRGAGKASPLTSQDRTMKEQRERERERERERATPLSGGIDVGQTPTNTAWESFFGFQAPRTVEAFCTGGCVLLIVIPLPIADAGIDSGSHSAQPR